MLHVSPQSTGWRPTIAVQLVVWTVTGNTGVQEARALAALEALLMPDPAFREDLEQSRR